MRRNELWHPHASVMRLYSIKEGFILGGGGFALRFSSSGLSLRFEAFPNHSIPCVKWQKNSALSDSQPLVLRLREKGSAVTEGAVGWKQKCF